MKNWLLLIGLTLGVTNVAAAEDNPAYEKPVSVYRTSGKPVQCLDHANTLADLQQAVDAFFQAKVFDPKAINPCLALFERYQGKSKQEIECLLRELAAQYGYYTYLDFYKRSSMLSFFFRYRTKAGLHEFSSDLAFLYDSNGRLKIVDRGGGGGGLIEVANPEKK